MAVQNPVSVIYNGAGTAVGTINDGTATRLQVQTQPLSLLAYNPANAIKTALLNGTSSNMLVNGGTTNVAFKYSASSTRSIVITNVMTIMSAAAVTMRGTYFASTNAALTNGILYQVTSAAVTSTVGTVKVNEDFLAIAGGLCVDATDSYLVANATMNAPLTAGSTDNVTVTVRDNLLASGVLGAVYAIYYLQSFAVGFYTS